jgi:hypothetical protein
VMAHLRRHGAMNTCEHVLQLIQNGSYPLAFSTRLVEYLLKHREHEVAGRIIEAVDRSGAKHALMDKLHSSWLWCIGRHRSALSFAIKSANYWQKSYLAHHVGTLYRCMADRKKSAHYRRKSEHYWRLAHALVKQEEQQEAQQMKGQN